MIFTFRYMYTQIFNTHQKSMRNNYETKIFKKLSKLPISNNSQKSNAQLMQNKFKNPHSETNLNAIIPPNNECLICCEQRQNKDILNFGCCSHRFCIFCLDKHIQTSIKNYDFVSCLQEGCSQIIFSESPHLKRFKPQLNKKYKKILFTKYQNKDPFIKVCSIDNCDGKINTKKNRITCSVCMTQYCKVCLNKKHKGDCRDEAYAKQLTKKLGLKQCPQCRNGVQKIDGCMFVYCIICKIQFCYKCGRKSVGDHICICHQKNIPVELQIDVNMHRINIERYEIDAKQRKKQIQVNNYQQQQQNHTLCSSIINFVVKLLIMIFLLPLTIILDLVILSLSILRVILIYFYVVLKRCKKNRYIYPCQTFSDKLKKYVCEIIFYFSKEIIKGLWR